MQTSTTVRRILGGVVLLAGGLLLACEQAPTATSDTDAAGVLFGRTNNNGARIWLPNYDHCAVVDGTGALFVPVACTMQVATPSANAEATVVVHASGVPNPTGNTVHWGPENPGWMWAGLFYVQFGLLAPPYPCAVILADGSFGFTLDWRGIVTPSGEATVTCHYSDKQPYQFPF